MAVKYQTLSQEIKRFVTMALAAYDSPSQVAERVRERFGIRVSKQAVARYDAETITGSEISAELRELFWATRRRFERELERVPVAHLPTRMRRLQHLAEAAEAAGDLKTAVSAHAVMAKEMAPYTYDADAE